MFSKLYELPIARNYVAGWGVVEAVRELIQNAIDSAAPFVWCFGSDSLTITSEGIELHPSTLLLGITSKADDGSKIGSFGEGYKLAVLVLLREGISVGIQNNSLTWVPAFKHSRQFETEVLTIRETKCSEARGQGLTFHMRGLTQKHIDQIISNTLQMQNTASIGVQKETTYGAILYDQPGKLYVNGLFVCDTEMKYGYNVKPEYLKLERDRQTVSGYDLKIITKKMLFETGMWPEIVADMADSIPDLEYSHWDSPEILKEKCYEHYIATTGNDRPIATTQQELKENIAAGMTKTVHVGGSYGHTIRSAPSYKANASMAKKETKSPRTMLTEWLSANRGNMRAPAIIAFKELVEKASDWK